MIPSTSPVLLKFSSTNPTTSSAPQMTFSKKPLKNAYLQANDTYLRLKREDDHLKVRHPDGRVTVTPRVAEAMRIVQEADRRYLQSDENKTTAGKLLNRLTDLVTRR